MWVREAIANEGNASAWSQLMAIEIQEGWSKTQFTREEARHFVPDAQGDLRPVDPHSFHSGWDEGVAFLD